MWGISRKFVLIQDGCDHSMRNSGYISAHFSGQKCSQAFVESALLLFKSIQRLI